MLIAAYALQVRNAFVYIRGEFDCPTAVSPARWKRHTTPATSAKAFSVPTSRDLVIYRGAGSYVCGEASALITWIEGKRGYPRTGRRV
jgi:NADH-quinone oxidoreductase subunit F